MAGRNIGIVTSRTFCHQVTPSRAAASSISTGRSCRAARNISMKVPVVVQMARKMMTHIATEGPESHSHRRPTEDVALAPGGVVPRAEPAQDDVQQPPWSR